MTKLVVLAGVTGHSGKYAVERLVQRTAECEGLRFRAIVRPGSDVETLRSWGLPMEIVTGDLTDEAFLRNALCGIDTLLNIVGIIYAPERVAQIALEAGAKRIISVHTTGIYSRYKYAAKGYLENDRLVTELCKSFHAARTILRPTMIYGGLDDQNVSTFIRMVDRFPVMPVVAGARFPLQPVHRRDLGHAYADVLLAPEATADHDYTLSGKDPIELRQMLSVIAQALGKKPRFFSVPYPIAYGGAWFLYVLSLGKADFREKVQRMVESRAYSHKEAERDFGYAPMSFSEGVQGEVEAYLAQKQSGKTK